jgi:hypothetical protein
VTEFGPKPKVDKHPYGNLLPPSYDDYLVPLTTTTCRPPPCVAEIDIHQQRKQFLGRRLYKCHYREGGKTLAEVIRDDLHFETKKLASDKTTNELASYLLLQTSTATEIIAKLWHFPH